MTKENYERQLTIEDIQLISILFGELDENIKIIEEKLNIKIALKQDKITIVGDEVSVTMGEELIEELLKIIKVQKRLSKQELNYTIQLVLEGKGERVKDLLNDVICITSSGKSIKPKTLGQKRYVDSIKNNDLVFGIGPAGTGKTYLAMAMAVNAFKNKEVNRIILTRPAVEAGESLGFLPGDLKDKVDPYLRPIYDALFDILGFDTYLRLMERGLIEVAPLAYMRGRTLDSAYIILDEAQNTTNEQMKMFLTRMGFGSKAIITGDITQIDLSKGQVSGLVTASKVLAQVKGIGICNLTKHDIVRHPLIQRIIEAYEKYENKK
ncbi:MAG: PhoH family protein [Tissierellia bacterium]|nr:PhoH family protein [Tissierellia bacterium]